MSISSYADPINSGNDAAWFHLTTGKITFNLVTSKIMSNLVRRSFRYSVAASPGLSVFGGPHWSSRNTVGFLRAPSQNSCLEIRWSPSLSSSRKRSAAMVSGESETFFSCSVLGSIILNTDWKHTTKKSWNFVTALRHYDRVGKGTMLLYWRKVWLTVGKPLPPSPLSLSPPPSLLLPPSLCLCLAQSTWWTTVRQKEIILNSWMKLAVERAVHLLMETVFRRVISLGPFKLWNFSEH